MCSDSAPASHGRRRDAVNGQPRIRELRLNEAGAEIGPEWQRLIESNDFNISLTLEFLRAAAAGAGLSDHVRVLTASEGNRVVGVLPFMVRAMPMYGLRLATIDLGGNFLVYHHEIVAPGYELPLLRACVSRRRWHVLRVESVPLDSPTSHALHAFARERAGILLSYEVDAAPYLPITESWEEFLAGKSASFRYTLRRKEKILNNGGQIEERWFERPEDVPELERCMHEIEDKSWKSRAGIAVTVRPEERRYYRHVLPFLARNGYLFASAIYINGRPAAYHLGYRFNGRIGSMKTSFDEAYRALSPGVVLLQRAIQRAFEVGAREFDFLGGVQHHKMLWTERARRHATYFLFSRRPLGVAVGAAKRLVRRWRRQEFHHVVRRSSVTQGSAPD